MNGILAKKRILVTYGPTWVAIDDMRVISNRSGGTMGKWIINGLIAAGAKVTALEGPVIEPLKDIRVRIKKFTFFNELSGLLKKELKKKYDIVIHAAAVSDFKPKKFLRKKISSDQPLTLALVPTEKLINIIKHDSPNSILVGFKLASEPCRGTLKKEALKLIRHNHCDLVVANSLKDGYTGLIFNKSGVLLAHGKSRKTVSRQLIKQLQNLCPYIPTGRSLH